MTYVDAFLFLQDKPNLQQQQPSYTSTAAGDGVHLPAFCPMAAPSPAGGFHSLWTLRRLAGPVGSSLRGDTMPTTAKAHARSPWGGISERPTMPQCAPSYTHSRSLATKWEPLAVFPTDSSPSVCYILMMRRMWF